MRRPYSGERAWMALIEKPEDTESDDQKACAEPDRTPPFDQGDEQRVGGSEPKASSAIQVEAVTNRKSSTGFEGAFAVEWNPFLCSIPAD